MPRTRRPHLPKAGFHITGRTQGGAEWFPPEMRPHIVADIEEATSAFGHQLLAHVVMPNHFHIVLKQGSTPLGWAMQRIMQRTVMRVRLTYGTEGHVFGRPYWSCVCANPAYLRRAIVYTHMNPVKAEICDHPGGYAWSSHNRYVSAALSGKVQSYAYDGLMLFANRTVDTAALVENYLVFVDYCIERRKSGIPGDWLLPEGPQRLLLPQAAHGDTHWASTYAAFTEPQSFTRSNIDVTAHATTLLKRIDPDLDLDAIRFAGRSRMSCDVRRQLIAGLLAAGCRQAAIARRLCVSATLVSRIASAMRYSAIPQM